MLIRRGDGLADQGVVIGIALMLLGEDFFGGINFGLQRRTVVGGDEDLLDLGGVLGELFADGQWQDDGAIKINTEVTRRSFWLVEDANDCQCLAAELEDAAEGFFSTE